MSDWKTIWGKKYIQNAPLHVMDGFDFLSLEQWKKIVKVFSELAKIDNESDILDIGCGSGAFLEQITNYKSKSGIDYSENAINNIANKITGEFKLAEADKLPFMDELFNIVLCFSVFFYFPSLQYAERVISEMLRVSRKGGKIFIADINDTAKLSLYNKIRKAEYRDELHLVKTKTPGHLFYDKDFFEQVAKKYKLKITIIDEDKLDLPFYTPSKYRFSVIYEI